MENFEKLYKKYYPPLFRYILSLSHNEHVSEDIVQETFFKALKHIDSYDSSQNIFVWLCVIAKNTYYSHCRKQRPITSDSDISTMVDEAPPTVDQMIQDENLRELSAALEMLKDPYHQVLILHVYNKMSFAEISKRYKKTESWARVTYHRAIKLLKEKINV